jgi:hypothetical protein
VVMPGRPFEVEEIERLALIDRLHTHHDSPPPPKASTKPESGLADNQE